MTLLTFIYSTHSLQLQLITSSIKLTLLPLKTTSLPSHVYSATLDTLTIDHKLTFIFNSIPALWNYLNFYKERSINIDFNHIKQQNQTLIQNYHSNNSLQTINQKDVELPISICLIILPDLQTLFKIKGQIAIDSLEDKYAKLLQEHQQLKDQLATTLSQYELLQIQSNILKERIATYEAQKLEKLKPSQEFIPRKRVHPSEEIQEGQYSKDILAQNIQPSPEEQSKNNSEEGQGYINGHLEINNERQLDTDQKKMAIFSQKCYMFVGYNERSEQRKGFVCIGCTKAFKQVSYLEKHLLSKHLELAQSSLSILEQKLALYQQKKSEEMKLENALKLYGSK